MLTLLLSIKKNKNSQHNDLGKIIKEYIDSIHNIAFDISLQNQLDTNFKPRATTYLTGLLISFMDKIIKHLTEFQCFIQFFNFQLFENNKYYLLFRKNSKAITPFICEILYEENDQTVDNQLNMKAINAYTYELYSFCLIANQKLTFDIENKIMDPNQSYIITTEILKNLLYALKKYYNYSAYFNNVMFYIVPLLQVHQPHFRILNDYYSFKRLLYVIMHALNYYFIEHNSSLLTNYDLSIYYLEFFIDPNYYNKNINTITNLVIKDNSESANYIYNFYIEYEILVSVIKSYTNIQFSWKGESLNMMEIYSNIISSVLSPYYIYDFFVLNFQLCTAAIYYELRHQEILLINNNLQSCELINVIHDFLHQPTNQPQNNFFLKIIKNYSYSLYIACDEILRATQDNEISSYIENKYKTIGIFFNFQTGHSSLYQDTKYTKQQAYKKLDNLHLLLYSTSCFFEHLNKLSIL